MVDAECAKCSVASDFDREMAVVSASPGGAFGLTQYLRSSLSADVAGLGVRSSDVDAFACGEPERLRPLAMTTAQGASGGGGGGGGGSEGGVGARGDTYPKAHLLDDFATCAEGTCSCNRCARSFRQGGMVMKGCRACSYDFCIACTASLEAQSYPVEAPRRWVTAPCPTLMGARAEAAWAR